MSEKKNTVGRPSKYNEEIQKYADDYIDNYLDYEVINDKSVPNTIPSKCDLAFKLRVHRETITNWGKENRQFLDTLERINQKQELMLSKFGLNRGYDGAITKMHMVNLTGYKDKVETINTNKEIVLSVDKDDAEL